MPPHPSASAGWRWGSRSTFLVVLAAVVVFVGAYAIGRSTRGSASDSSAAAAPRPGSGTAPTTSVLPGLVLQPKDVTSALSVSLLQGGTEVRGQTTLDLCNATFPSESLRTERVQDVAIDSAGDSVVSTEAVLYRNPGDTTQAFSELHRAAAQCPDAPVTSPVGEPTVTTKFGSAPDASWPSTPSVDRQAYSFVSTDQSGQSQHSIAVYLRRGRVLMGIYFSQPDSPQPPIDGQTTIAGVVQQFSGRIARLPASTVGH